MLLPSPNPPYMQAVRWGYSVSNGCLRIRSRANVTDTRPSIHEDETQSVNGPHLRTTPQLNIARHSV